MRVFHATDDSISSLMRDGDYAVAPHNHSFDIALFPLSGRAYNVLMFTRPYAGIDFQYQISKPDESSFGLGQSRPIELHSMNPSRITGNGVELREVDVHSVIAESGASWLAVQISEDKAPPLYCYSRRPDFIVAADGMYAPMTAGELAEQSYIFDAAMETVERLASEGVITWQA